MNAHHVEVYYDRSIRLWNAYLVDADGNQVADAAQAMTKAEAVKYANLQEVWD